MQAAEKIIEAYVRYVKGWLTMAGIKCKGQFEIDLIAADLSDPRKRRLYHIESVISTSDSFSKLNNKPYSPEAVSNSQKARRRRTLDFFIERKFENTDVLDKLATYGFIEGNYQKIVVSWGWSDDVPEAAKKARIELWDFRTIVKELEGHAREISSFLPDDTMRTIQLLAKASTAPVEKKTVAKEQKYFSTPNKSREPL